MESMTNSSYVVYITNSSIKFEHFIVKFSIFSIEHERYNTSLLEAISLWSHKSTSSNPLISWKYQNVTLYNNLIKNLKANLLLCVNTHPILIFILKVSAMSYSDLRTKVLIMSYSDLHTKISATTYSDFHTKVSATTYSDLHTKVLATS
jgi:hypothetical protein